MVKWSYGGFNFGIFTLMNSFWSILLVCIDLGAFTLINLSCTMTGWTSKAMKHNYKGLKENPLMLTEKKIY
jgi:hypothetical protein